ncbi:DUF4135 domain-containing protein (plasmid) [Rhizobium leguminosarum bv. viciae]|nr:DUF4135 domain-containing protein [Rhizobium leguminosarum bv. viciae]
MFSAPGQRIAREDVDEATARALADTKTCDRHFGLLACATENIMARSLNREGYAKVDIFQVGGHIRWKETRRRISEPRLPSVSTCDQAKKPLGKVAALFWLLNATDLHVENLVGQAGGYLALDTETILSAPIIEPVDAPDPSWRSNSLLTTQLIQISYGETRRRNISGSRRVLKDTAR